ncbi:MAG: class II fructose-bisphosphate aldolase family protein [Anaerolineae bacterium]|nr:class II fructose-bisphosphate aldolase family protein [Anaerolineae bacterium]
MARVKACEIYRRAREGGYAIGGFCAENLEMVQAIVGAAEDTRSPLVLMLWQEDILAVGPGYLEQIALYAAERSSVPVALMVDHASSLAFCLQCMLNGHTGLMIDASHLPLAENIRLTRQVCELAHLADVLVEGELGTVRRSFESEGAYAQQAVMTEPDQVPRFVAETGVDALAVSIGTESGIPEVAPLLDLARLERIAEVTDAYLVLHGGSGTPDEAIRELVRAGMTAMRFASALRVTFLDAVERARAELGRAYPDTRRIYGPARDRVRSLVAGYMRALGCAGQADRW